MAWKRLKEHFQIGHIVQIKEQTILIGSPYVSDLISVSADGACAWGKLGASTNPDLARYFAEMRSAPTLVRELIASPDSFSAHNPVFTYEGGTVLEKKCEEYGWPNVTHDGLLMYENSFFREKSKAIEKAKNNARAGIKSWTENIAEAEAALAIKRAYLAEEIANLSRLDTDYP